MSELKQPALNMEKIMITEIKALNIFTKQKLEDIFPDNRADRFFEALYGDASEGAYDISLEFSRMEKTTLVFEFHLKQRPGKCLACNLTYGLPEVFLRHPVININELAKKINSLLGEQAACTNWKMGTTKKLTTQLYILPLFFEIS